MVDYEKCSNFLITLSSTNNEIVSISLVDFLIALTLTPLTGIVQEQCLMSVLEMHALEHEVMDNCISLAIRRELSRPAAANMSSDTHSKSDTATVSVAF